MKILASIFNFIKYIILILVALFAILYFGTNPKYEGIITHDRSNLGEIIIKRE